MNQIHETTEDSLIGFILEVYLEFSEELNNSHHEHVLAPTKEKVPQDCGKNMSVFCFLKNSFFRSPKTFSFFSFEMKFFFCGQNFLIKIPFWLRIFLEKNFLCLENFFFEKKNFLVGDFFLKKKVSAKVFL